MQKTPKMTITHKREQLAALIERYNNAKSNGSLDNATEETIRMWINEMLSVFGWNVQDTQQVLQERRLEQDLRNKLQTINSNNTRPDYTLVNGGVKLCFVDAKNLSVNIKHDSKASFQIRSYGWSAGAKFSIVTNFEELSIYDCSQIPDISQSSDFARLHYFELHDLLDNFEIVDSFFCRDAIINNTFKISHSAESSPDEVFAEFLCSTRVYLANSILQNNDATVHHNNSSLLGLWVQIIINRILFIRVCESRGLEEEGLLNRFAENNFWDSFRNSSYLDFYNHYDGPIFSRIEAIHNLKIDNEVFLKMLKGMYYPSPYRFDVMPIKSISDIYDIFLSSHLEINDDGVAFDSLKSEYRKSRGAVVTPTHIVQKVIEQTIPIAYIESLSVDEMLSIAILDPACGSGVFLAELYDYISSALINKIKDSGITSSILALFDNNEVYLTIDGKRAIINNCLYGIDIDREAVEVARMSLALKIVDSCTPVLFQATGLLGHQILNGIGENIKCGNTLVASDIHDSCPDVRQNTGELMKMKIFNWHEAFVDVHANGGFDFVIGNPPYVEVKNYNSDLPTMVEYIKKTYASSKDGKIDLAVPFIEKGISMLNSQGRLGYIVQKRFFKTNYGKGIRRYIADNRVLSNIYDYEDTDIFKRRITYVAIVVCDKNTTDNDYVLYQNSTNESTESIPIENFSDTPWDFSNIELQNLRTRLCSLGTVASAVDIKVGIQALWDRAYQIKASEVTDDRIIGKSTIDQDIQIEKMSCRAIVCNEGVTPFSHGSYKTYALFPYKVEGGQVAPILYSDFNNIYPDAGAYLDKHKNVIIDSVETLPQIKLGLDPNEHWHLFTRVQNHSATYNKVCIPMTSRYPTAIVVNENNVYCDNANMYFVYIPESTEVKMYAFAAIVNSNIFSTLARSIANPQQGGYYKFNKQFLDPIPFPSVAFAEETSEIIRLSELGKSIEECNHAATSASDAEIASLKSAISHMWSEVDSICDTLYGIDNYARELLYTNLRDDR